MSQTIANAAGAVGILSICPATLSGRSAPFGFVDALVMSDLIPVTDEMLELARNDRDFRRRLLSEHLDELTAAMANAKDRARTRPNPDPTAARQVQEAARLAVKLVEILHNLGAGSDLS